MKKIILLIYVITIPITFSSCRTRIYYYYAFCEINHDSWEGPKHEWYAGEDRGDTKRSEAQSDAGKHDGTVHGGMKTAEIRDGMYYK